jgi:GTPase SAR1 family protein
MPNLALLHEATKSQLCFYPHPRTKMSDLEAYDLRARYTRFRILVIGRANAGKTTLLQRVCNTTEDPCIFDDNGKNLVSCS